MFHPFSLGFKDSTDVLQTFGIVEVIAIVIISSLCINSYS